jgi:hypothetical protein
MFESKEPAVKSLSKDIEDIWKGLLLELDGIRVEKQRFTARRLIKRKTPLENGRSLGIALLF